MNEPKIEKGVAMPPGTRAPGRWRKLFQQMSVGDSFAVDAKDAKPQTLYQAGNHFAKKYAPKTRWVARAVVEGGVKKVRVWRVE